MKFLDLTHELHGDAPVAPILPPATFERVMSLEHGEPNVMMCSMPSHFGTHVDAPSHFIPGGMTVENIPLDWLVGRASLVSLELLPRQPITGAMLEEAGAHVMPEDRMFLATGFSARYLTHEYVEHPYLDDTAASWILDRGVRLLGLDCLTPDKPHSLRDETFDFPVHHRLLGAEVLIAENVRLDPRPPDVFEVTLMPLPIRGGDGAPARVVAQV